MRFTASTRTTGQTMVAMPPRPITGTCLLCILEQCLDLIVQIDHRTRPSTYLRYPCKTCRAAQPKFSNNRSSVVMGTSKGGALRAVCLSNCHSSHEESPKKKNTTPVMGVCQSLFSKPPLRVSTKLILIIFAMISINTVINHLLRIHNHHCPRVYDNKLLLTFVVCCAIKVPIMLIGTCRTDWDGSLGVWLFVQRQLQPTP